MSFFGVELNAQVNKLNLQIRLLLARNRHSPNFRTLYRGFYGQDKGLSGMVTAEQFEDVLGKNGIFFKKFEYQAYQKAYGDGGANVNWFEFLRYLKEPMSPERRKLVQAIFDSLDAEKKGVIPYETLIKSFNPKEFEEFKLGHKTKQQLERQLLGMVNLDGNGSLTRQEFINFFDDLSMNIPGDLAFKTHVSSMWNYNPQKDEKIDSQELKSAIRKIRFKLIQATEGTHQQFLLKKVFDEFDRAQQGYLLPQDLYLMLVKLEVPVEKRLLEPVFNKFDRNCNGTIEYNEFKNFLFFDPYPI